MSKIIIPLIFLLKITESFKKSVPKVFKTDDNEIVDSDSSRTNEMIMNLSKNLIGIPNIGAIRKPTFLILKTKKSFNHVKQTFIKAPILQHFDLKILIWIETNV